MKRKFSFKTFWSKALICLAVAAAMLTACKKDDGNGPDIEDPDEPVTVVMQDVALSGTVRDTDGNPLSGVRVSTGSLNATTGADGVFTFDKAGTVDKRAVIQFDKSGYFTLTRSGPKADEMNIAATLQRKGNGNASLQTSFSSAEAKTLSVAGMEVSIPASALVKADGSSYSGNVTADMFYLDPNNGDFTELMPGGDLSAIRTNNSEVQLLSYGMTEVSLTDNAGNALQMKEGASSELTFPIPDGMENNPPATIPLWYFDEDKGIWIEEGTATLRGNVYVGSVTHFSWHNLDVPAERVTIKGKVTDCEDKPVTYIKISVEQTAAVTNSKGEYSVFVPANTPVTLTVKSEDYDNYSPEKSINVPGKPGGTLVSDQNIVLPCRSQITEPGDDAVFTIDKASVTYLSAGDEVIITIDNFGKQIRWDTNYGTDDHGVIIFDNTARIYTIGAAGQWFDMPYTDEINAEILFALFISNDDLYSSMPGFTVLPNETIAGKSCRVITFAEEECYAKFATWNGLLMLTETCEGIQFVATNVNLTVPANAFTKTFTIF